MAEIISPIKAIRAYCLGCCNGNSNAVRDCVISECELYPFRFGKNPYRHNSRTYSEEEKAAIGERLKKARQNK